MPKIVSTIFSVWRRLWPSSHYALLSVFFFAGLEVIFIFHQLIPLLVLAVIGLLVLGIILIRTEEGGRFHPTQTILPILTALSLIGFALFLPFDGSLHVYFLLAAVLFFGVLKYGVKQAYPTWNWIISLTVLFMGVGTILGWRFNLYTPVAEALALLFAMFFLISLQSLNRLTDSTAEASLLALSTAFVLTETAWVLQFLPLHYLVQAAFLVGIYYVLFHLATVSFERSLQRRDILEYMAVGGGALFIILLTAHWT